MKSIMQDRKECYVCKTTFNLHYHHIYFGANRKVSDEYGCTCWLCYQHHNGSNAGVHFNRELDLRLKTECQKRFEQVYPEKSFLRTFGRNYL